MKFYNRKQAVEIFMLVGGIPKYLLAFEEGKAIEEALYELFVDEFAPFKEDAYEIIEKTDPILSRKKRDAKYEISDHYYNFYFNIIDRYFSAFEFDREKTYKRVYPLIPNHLGIMFERFCMQLIKENPGMLPFIPEQIGKHLT